MTEQCGTPAYIAPEIFENKGYTGYASDIWSAGCVLYEVIMLRPPFQASDMDQLFRKITRGAYQSLSSQYSSDLNTVIKVMLQ